MSAGHRRWITIGDVAKALHLSRPTASKYLHEGRVPGLLMHFGYPRVEREVYEKWSKSKDREKLG